MPACASSLPRVWMSRREAEGFYAVHKDRPFFGELVEFMSSAPTVVQVLEGENAIAKNREVMGATNPANADEGTIRKVHALSIGENSVHGSDAPETAAAGDQVLVLRHRDRRLNQRLTLRAQATVSKQESRGFAPAFLYLESGKRQAAGANRRMSRPSLSAITS